MRDAKERHEHAHVFPKACGAARVGNGFVACVCIRREHGHGFSNLRRNIIASPFRVVTSGILSFFEAAFPLDYLHLCLR